MDADTESVSSSGVDGGTSSVATNDSGGGGTSRSEPVTIRIRTGSECWKIRFSSKVWISSGT
ncbi:Hypothetical protein FKW44_024783 [Caligus rogercresseyi]|uniref:Uncharacterized protein n=1 Tax=Caligus rogercresseyi TaxID=217165 RepID=A0A7T8GMJ1_CALRO|nr:Hypothetical protein FKW44_024783 [Caligus rogercresseyi]